MAFLDKLAKYFTLTGQSWEVKNQLRAMVCFRKVNLIQPFVGLGTFNIVFRRNVAIYCTLKDRKKTLE